MKIQDEIKGPVQIQLQMGDVKKFLYSSVRKRDGVGLGVTWDGWVGIGSSRKDLDRLLSEEWRRVGNVRSHDPRVDMLVRGTVPQV